jgi:hypothetical protein
MRLIFGVMSLLFVLLVVGTLVKKNLAGLTTLPSSTTTDKNSNSPVFHPDLNNSVTQSQQIQLQLQQSLEISEKRRKAIDQ